MHLNLLYLAGHKKTSIVVRPQMTIDDVKGLVKDAFNINQPKELVQISFQGNILKHGTVGSNLLENKALLQVTHAASGGYFQWHDQYATYHKWTLSNRPIDTEKFILVPQLDAHCNGLFDLI
eukprot:TRINITY_DN3252_c2_g1_i1.p2 TRINITY_DN3252_c2_g1~~TRINITY_DN3252_c2_g1_i1.p2  ORF type:complete len:122 (-),score=0.51 TRINITY_DN3252_c2_g1_i1:394-759(-)